MTTKVLTERSMKLFLEYAEDADNWSGMPPVGVNVGGSKEDRGNLTDLKKSGLITTEVSEGFTWISFTAAGRALAKEHGIEILDFDALTSMRVS